MTDPLTIHEFRDRAALLRDAVNAQFDHGDLQPAVRAVDAALSDLQQRIEALSETAA